MIEKKDLQRKKLGKRQLATVICASVLVFLIAGYATINTLIASGVIGGGGDDSSSSTADPIELRDGEALYANRGVAYPYLAKNRILTVRVDSHVDSFVMSRPVATDENGEKVEGQYEDYFVFSYDSENGKQVYYPDILEVEPDTSYTDFYSIEASDGLNAYKIDYLCAAIGALFFEDRIEPASGTDFTAIELGRYGLTAEYRERIDVDYLDSEGKLQTYTIYVGDKLITGQGYYFMLDGRNYIYTAPSGETLSYLLGEFESFLHSRIIATGLESDSLYEPYLTTNYTQWTNKYYSMNNGGLGRPVAEGSEVVIYADLLTPRYASDGNSYIGDGYSRSGYKVDLVDLGYVADRPEFERIKALLLANTVGSYEGGEIIATVITNLNEANLGKTYKYTVTEIESVLTDTFEFTEEGYSVGDARYVKVGYYATIDGEDQSDEIMHAVLDLNDSLIPEDVKAALREKKVGDSCAISYETVYSEENSIVRNMQMVITDIHIISKIDEKGNISYPKKIAEDSLVTYSYKYVVDGYEIGEEGRSTVDLSQITEEGDNLLIKNALLGREVESDIDLRPVTEKLYCQSFSDFITYSIREIRGYVEKELIVSFAFQNASERDPFYGESIYKNTLDNENKFYALDATACERVTYLLGGIGSGSNSQLSAGLVGKETVAVGLNPAVMDRYGLYDGYTVYFELPRGISVVGGAASDEIDDYKYLSTLGFTLYISKPQSDGTRYIASTMYDIVVKIDGAGFEYLEKSFAEYWARRNLVMVDYKLIDKIDFELSTTELYGKYSFTVKHTPGFLLNNEILPERTEDGKGTELDILDITVTPKGDDYSETVFSEILESEGRESISLKNLYRRVWGDTEAFFPDDAGAANYKEFLRLIYGVYYTGTVSEEEQAEALENAPKIFSMTFGISGEPYGYVYDFYRTSSRRVVVHIYRLDANGNAITGKGSEVSGFYVSTFAAKKIMNAVSSMLNAEMIDVDQPYWDETD